MGLLLPLESLLGSLQPAFLDARMRGRSDIVHLPIQSRIPVSFRLTSRLASQVPDDAPNGETACAESIKWMSSKNIFHYPLYHASRI